MDIQPEKTCCFTGHRPQFFPWGSNTGDPAAAKMLRALESEILQAIHHNVNILFNHSNRSKPFFHIDDSLHICFYLADQSGIVIQIVVDSIAGQSNHSVKYPVRQKCSTGYDLPYRFYPASAFAHQESAQKQGMGSHAENPIFGLAGAAISGISISSAHRVVISFCVRLS